MLEKSGCGLAGRGSRGRSPSQAASNRDEQYAIDRYSTICFRLQRQTQSRYPAAMQNQRPSRRHPVHLPNLTRHNHPVILHVTVCTHDRRPVLANDAIHAHLIAAFQAADAYHVGRYMVMPDHIHLFCSPAASGAGNVARWVAYWKRLVTIQVPDLRPLWQRDCWDTQMRGAQQYHEKWLYIRENPVRKELVQDSAKWPYQGELNVLPW